MVRARWGPNFSSRKECFFSIYNLSVGNRLYNFYFIQVESRYWASGFKTLVLMNFKLRFDIDHTSLTWLWIWSTDIFDKSSFGTVINGWYKYWRILIRRIHVKRHQKNDLYCHINWISSSQFIARSRKNVINMLYDVEIKFRILNMKIAIFLVVNNKKVFHFINDTI